MDRGGTRILFIVFGLLDLVAFYASFGPLLRTIESFETLLVPFGIPALNVLLTLSLLVSGPLAILGNPRSYSIYYFQFPFRLAFLRALTFGFLLKMFPTQVGTFAHGMMMAGVFGLEAVRLMITIQRHKAIFSSNRS